MNSTAIEQPVMLAIYPARCTNSLNLQHYMDTTFKFCVKPIRSVSRMYYFAAIFYKMR